MNIDDNNIQHWLQECAAQGNIPVKEQDWAEMAYLLSRQKKKRFFFWRWYFWLILFFATASIYLFIDGVAGNQKNAKELSQRKPAIAGENYHKKYAITATTEYKGKPSQISTSQSLREKQTKTDHHSDPIIKKTSYDVARGDLSITASAANKAAALNAVIDTKNNTEPESNDADFNSTQDATIIFLDSALMNYKKVFYQENTINVKKLVALLKTPDTLAAPGNLVMTKKAKTGNSWLTLNLGLPNQFYKHSLYIGILYQKPIYKNTSWLVGAQTGYLGAWQQQQFVQVKSIAPLPGSTTNIVRTTTTRFTPNNTLGILVSAAIEQQLQKFSFNLSFNYLYSLSGNNTINSAKDTFRLYNIVPPDIKVNNAYQNSQYNGKQMTTIGTQVNYAITKKWQLGLQYLLPLQAAQNAQISAMPLRGQFQLQIRKRFKK